MRRVPLAGAAAAVVLGLAGVVSFSAVSQAAGTSPAKSTTLVFDVVFSPFEPVQANNIRHPKSPFALGDEIVAHDQLFSHGKHVGDDALSCVVVAVPPDVTLANCTGIFRVPGGTVASGCGICSPRWSWAATRCTGTSRSASGAASS